MPHRLAFASILMAVVLAGCQTTDNSSGGRVDPATLPIVFWPGDDRLPATFSNGWRRSTSGASWSTIWHREENVFAIMGHSVAYGDYYIYAPDGDSSTENLVADFVRTDKSNVLIEKEFSVSSPIGELSGVLTNFTEEGVTSYCAAAYAQGGLGRRAHSYQNQTFGIVCRDAPYTVTDVKRVAAGIGVGQDRPDESLRPKIDVAYPETTADWLTLSAEITWAPRGTDPKAMIRFEDARSSGNIEFTHFAVSGVCTGRWVFNAGSYREGGIRGTWSARCQDGALLSGTFRSREPGFGKILGRDQDGNEIRGTYNPGS